MIQPAPTPAIAAALIHIRQAAAETQFELADLIRDGNPAACRTRRYALLIRAIDSIGHAEHLLAAIASPARPID